jgi:hypothetical protein
MPVFAAARFARTASATAAIWMFGQPFRGIVLPSDEASLQRQIRDRPLLGAGVGRGL